MSTAGVLLTAEDLLSMPADGARRWLVRGQLREQPMTVRNRHHSRIMARISHVLEAWLAGRPAPRGAVFCGEAGCRLARDPDTVVGIDVAYISPEVSARQTDETTLIEGAPTLAVEILSPNDTQEQIHEKLEAYLEAGVLLVWVVNPYDSTVTVYRPDGEPEMFNVRQELSGEPHLPGFRVAVQAVFGG